MEVAEKERMPRLSLGEERNMVTQLLLLNVTVYILLYFIKIIYQLENFSVADFDNDILRNTVVSAQPMTLLTKPWTLLTAMFTHTGFWDIFSNMVWLFCFGTLLQQASGFRVIVPLYVFGSLCGYTFYIAGMQFVPSLQPLAAAGAGVMGAGAGVTALAIGVTTLAPGNRVFPLLLRGGIPVWIITLIYIALYLTSVFTGNGSGATLLYLAGGAFMGFLFMNRYKKGHNWSARFNAVFFNVSHVFHSKKDKDALREELMEADKPSRKTANPAPFVKVGHIPEHKINELLDKISEQGMQSLSPEEKETLLRASREQEPGN
ncbi:rhomboid family intramembrane serine protease [Chitinophaga sp. GCM10012297]|uniref:Rhomboid family intramembrane serine protease n=1 Tax=Chitinophaga chungangae TaxID=2821488 RepID=A0ABS3YDL6_9BACT|nr:rhomboid family intramembrane serine protease [Chitinophaga chungangae]MBO9152775.1 rhomboid family intramembrane serine protease [Chitinophaga chungangae]